MTENITVGPAYGRDYKSKAAAIADWNADKDFTVLSMGRWCGAKVNKPDAVRAGIGMVTIRYKAQTMAVVVNADGTVRK